MLNLRCREEWGTTFENWNPRLVVSELGHVTRLTTQKYFNTLEEISTHGPPNKEQHKAEHC